MTPGKSTLAIIGTIAGLFFLALIWWQSRHWPSHPTAETALPVETQTAAGTTVESVETQETTKPSNVSPTTEQDDIGLITLVDESLIDQSVLDARLVGRSYIIRYSIAIVDSEGLMYRFRNSAEYPTFKIKIFPDVALTVTPRFFKEEVTEGLRAGYPYAIARISDGHSIDENGWTGSMNLMTRPDGGVIASLHTPAGEFQILPMEYGNYHLVLEYDRTRPIPLD